MEQLSKNFTYEELVRSSTATAKKIKNVPNAEEKENLKKLCQNILQPIRQQYGKPITVSSGYRSRLLNQAVGGAKTSDHVNGNAADIHTLSDSVEDNKELYNVIVHLIKSNVIDVGQCINEYNYNWIHVSNPTKKHHNEIFAIK